MKSESPHRSITDSVSLARQVLRCVRLCFPTPILLGGLVVIAALIFVQTWRTSRATQKALYTTESELNRNVAAGLAEKLRGFSERDPGDSLAYKLDELATINPSLRIYVLNNRGIVTASPHVYGRVKIPFVNLQPVRDRLGEPSNSGQELGDDPHNAGQRVPFSVATLRIAGESCYLYVITSNASLYNSFMAVAGKEVALTTFFTALGSTVFVVTIVVFMFYRRLKALSTALAVLSHDLRGPLTSIQGSLETILDRGESLTSCEASRFMRVALRSTKSATMMLNDLHHLSKIEAAGDAVLMEPLSIGDLLMDTVMAVQVQSLEKGISIVTSDATDIPLVHGNPELLERLVRNVVDNAIRYTPIGGKIDISLSSVRNKIRVTILDNGPGIPEGELAAVTKRFVRSARTVAKANGSGIGLSVAAEVARMHGGELRILSRENEGTAVIFELQQARLSEESLAA